LVVYHTILILTILLAAICAEAGSRTTSALTATQSITDSREHALPVTGEIRHQAGKTSPMPG